MELATITMDKNQARRAFLEYRHAVRQRHDEEDAQIMRGYRALAQGRQLVNLAETLRAGGSEVRTFPSRRRRGGQDQQFRLPRLAVVRADAKRCYTVGISAEGGVTMTADAPESALSERNRKDTFRVPRGTFEEGTAGWRYGPTCRAIVPIVPPPLRPIHSLRGYMVLWEANWELYIPPQPPGDPALLKHIGGNLYAVVAIWDLSPLEQTVLAARG